MSLKNEINFSLKFLSSIIENNENSNVVFSPASILNSLAMIFAGCDGITAEELEKQEVSSCLILGYWIPFISENSQNTDETLEYYSNFHKFCQSSENTKSKVSKIILSNKLFLTKQHPLHHSYVKIMEKMLENGFEQVDFLDKRETIEKINKFVAEKTEGILKEIISEEDIINEKSHLLMINALCFIGEWEVAFQDPIIEKFYSSSGTYRDMEMLLMRALFKKDDNLYDVGEWNLTKGDGWACLGIPYKERKSWMHILLPNKRDGLPELIKALDYSIIQKCVKKTPATLFKAIIPAFEIEQSYDLTEKMKALGLSHLFSGGNGIHKMFEKNQSFVDCAVHKARIKMDRHGTFGYAKGGPCYFPDAAFQYEPFIADHPFLYFLTLCEDKNPQKLKSILLMGTFC